MKAPKIANLTPHSLVLFTKDGKKLEIEPFGFALRVGEVVEDAGEIYNIQLIRKELTEIDEKDIQKLKEIIEEHDLVIVSLLALKKVIDMKCLTEKEIQKLFAIGRTVRNEKGQIIGADALIRALDLIK
jgi:hypothetical protein